MSKVGGIFLIIVALGLALYIFNSGGAEKLGAIFKPTSAPTSTVSVATNTIEQAATTTTTTQATSSNPFVQFFISLFSSQAATGSLMGSVNGGSGNTAVQTSNSGGTATATITPSTSSIPAWEIPQGLTLAQLSPYFQWIRFDGIGSSEIGLTASGIGTGTTTIDITGWEIKTNRGGEYIPQAVTLYDPSAAPIESDIVLTTGAGDFVALYSNSAPVNLRLNECMGYLNATHQFNPPLPSSCPAVDRSQIASFTGQCQDYILSLGCNAVDMSNVEIPRNDYACQQYLENNFTYQSCVANHATDNNFLSNDWYVWTGSNPLDPYHDNVELLDRNGLVVDTYNY